MYKRSRGLDRIHIDKLHSELQSLWVEGEDYRCKGGFFAGWGRKSNEPKGMKKHEVAVAQGATASWQVRRKV